MSSKMVWAVRGALMASCVSDMPDQAACAKRRLGIVDLGTEENQWSQIANSCASVERMGSEPAWKQRMITAPRAAFPLSLA